jgi:mono/diheme cytochrome c family protein
LSTAILPDLRRSPLIRNRPAFESVVLKGALSDRGMVSFAGHLTEDQVDAVRAYISAGARLLQRQSATLQ